MELIELLSRTEFFEKKIFYLYKLYSQWYYSDDKYDRKFCDNNPVTQIHFVIVKPDHWDRL